MEGKCRDALQERILVETGRAQSHSLEPRGTGSAEGTEQREPGQLPEASSWKRNS